MSATFVADKVKNIVAIYTGGEDEAIEDAPLSHMDKVIFHSDLPYVEAVDIVSGSTSNPTASSTNYGLVSTVNLFAHGKSYTPLVLGFLKNIYDIDGNVWSKVPAMGSVPNWKEDPQPRSNYYQVGLTSIFADDTYVKAITFFWDEGSLTELYGTLEWEVHVTNVALEGSTINPPASSELILIDDNEITVAGKFSSESAHYSTGGSAGKVFLPNCQTLNAEQYGFRTCAMTIDGTKFISSPYGVNLSKSDVVDDAALLTGAATNLRVNT